jgi:FeS assembly SUF system regulator
MVKLNRLTDYAVVVMVHLARSDAVMAAGQLARETGLPQPTVAKLLGLLAKSGLLAAHRGASGGYTLSRNPAVISAAEIVETVEGPITLAACVSGADQECDLEASCVMRGHWDTVNAAISKALGGVSLEEMAKPNFPFLDPPSGPEADREVIQGGDGL